MEPSEEHRTPTRSRAASRSRPHTPGPSPIVQHIQAALPTSSTNELTVHRESDVVVAVVPSEDHSPLEDERAAPVQLNEDVTLALRTQLRKTLNRMGSVPPTPTSGNLDTPFRDAPQFSPGPGEMALPQDAIVQALETPQVDQYPPREYFILTHAGKPVFASRLFTPPHTKPSQSTSSSNSMAFSTGHSASNSISLQTTTSASYASTIASPTTLPRLPGSGDATPIPGPIFLPPPAVSAPAAAQAMEVISESREEDVSSAMGLLQALVSVFADDGDRIRCINAGRTRITFVLRAPLYYACVSSWGEPESVILTVLTGTQLQKIFERRGNFDLRRLLDGTDPLIHSLTARLSTDLSITLASLHTLRVDPGLRFRAAELILPSKDTKDVLYVIVFSGDKVVTLVQTHLPTRTTWNNEISDLHLLLNTLSSPALRSSSSASWLPICLPKFSPKGFLYCYVSFLESGDTIQIQNAEGGPDPGIGLAIITPDRDGFEKIRSLADGAEAALVKANMPNLLSQAAQCSPYSVSELGITGLLHFVYKSRTLVQVTHPQWDPTINQPRLVTLYQTIHDALHAKSGQQSGPTKLQLIKTDTECVMGWITQPFEIYVAVEPQLPKNAIVGAANAIARWVKKEEGKLFLRDAPVF
ncbi:Vacuolar fusion protein mon1 [Ceratobasidium sp. 414]|nr:Vacuolar fusion protein mon1 [Ceratobasidium sp. 414]